MTDFTLSTLSTIDRDLLSTAAGGQAAPQQGKRTWGRIAADYAGACIGGAGQQLLAGGRPRSWGEAAATAGFGCVLGVGQQAVRDLTGGQ